MIMVKCGHEVACANVCLLAVCPTSLEIQSFCNSCEKLPIALLISIKTTTNILAAALCMRSFEILH